MDDETRFVAVEVRQEAPLPRVLFCSWCGASFALFLLISPHRIADVLFHRNFVGLWSFVFCSINLMGLAGLCGGVTQLWLSHERELASRRFI